MNPSYASGLRRLAEETEGLRVEFDYPLSELTSVGTGGRAKVFVAVERVRALKKLMRALRRPFFVLGSGTNLLLADRDFPGTIVHLGSAFGRIRLEGDRLFAGAAASLGRLVDTAIEHAFPGFEELAGVPGSVGGAAAMNAGTHIVELGDLVDRMSMVDTDGNRRTFGRDRLSLSYRTTLAPLPGVITSLSFLGRGRGDRERQRERAMELTRGRKLKHPWQARTFGSSFKNPPGEIAAKLIDGSGLKGVTVGGARVSPKHANFIENYDNAASRDILELIRLVRSTVFQQTGISLEPEVRLVGFTAGELGDLAPYAAAPVQADTEPDQSTYYGKADR